MLASKVNFQTAVYISHRGVDKRKCYPSQTAQFREFVAPYPGLRLRSPLTGLKLLSVSAPNFSKALEGHFVRCLAHFSDRDDELET